MLEKLFIALSRFAYAELTRHIREDKKAAALAFAAERRRLGVEKRRLTAA